MAVMQPINTSDLNGDSSNEDLILPSADLMLMNLLQPTVNEDIAYPAPAAPVSDWIDSNSSPWFLMKSQQGRKKRQNTNHHLQHVSSRRGTGSSGGAQLSISASIDALRSRLFREMLRRDNERQIEVNSKILTETGKRRKRDINNTSRRTRSSVGESQQEERTGGITAP